MWLIFISAYFTFCLLGYSNQIENEYKISNKQS